MQKRHRSFALGLVGAALFTFAPGVGQSQTRDGMQDGSASNPALGKPCQVFSSREEQGWSAAKLTDGETSLLGWSSKAFAEYAVHALYLEFGVVDLGTNCVLRRENNAAVYAIGSGTYRFQSKLPETGKRNPKGNPA